MEFVCVHLNNKKVLKLFGLDKPERETIWTLWAVNYLVWTNLREKRFEPSELYTGRPRKHDVTDLNTLRCIQGDQENMMLPISLLPINTPSYNRFKDSIKFYNNQNIISHIFNWRTFPLSSDGSRLPSLWSKGLPRYAKVKSWNLRTDVKFENIFIFFSFT